MFVLSPDDIAAAAAARIRGPVARQRIVMTVVIVFSLLVVYASEGGPTVFAVVFTVILLVPLCLLLFAWLSPRRLASSAVGNQVRDNPWLASPITVELWPTGVRTQTVTATASMSWQQYPFRIETDRFVLLLTGPGRYAQVQILPLKAVDEAGRPALMALLAQHTQLIPDGRAGRSL
ncbi:hypothetical protein BCD48_27075 [Pseudofrankia sp. BMG5.36]|nr:hypothetical protein BCD48_27075 [Pseudofrankia sp. BMG5.36]